MPCPGQGGGRCCLCCRLCSLSTAVVFLSACGATGTVPRGHPAPPCTESLPASGCAVWANDSPTPGLGATNSALHSTHAATAHARTSARRRARVGWGAQRVREGWIASIAMGSDWDRPVMVKVAAERPNKAHPRMSGAVSRLFANNGAARICRAPSHQGPYACGHVVLLGMPCALQPASVWDFMGALDAHSRLRVWCSVCWSGEVASHSFLVVGHFALIDLDSLRGF